ncbi:PYK1, partial [Symbiodinium sp. CCMP2456]
MLTAPSSVALAAGLATAVAAPLFVAPSTGTAKWATALRGSRAAPEAVTQAAPGAMATVGTAGAVVALAALGASGAKAGTRKPRMVQVARQSVETFQQNELEYPAAYEKIADVNNKEKEADIICTIGPKSWDPEVLVELMKAGMNVIRCNMSHGDHE